MDELRLLLVRSFELITMFVPELITRYEFPFDGTIFDEHDIHNNIIAASEFYTDVHGDELYYDTPNTVSRIIKGLERYDEYELCSIMRDVRNEMADRFAEHPELKDYYKDK